MARSIFWQTIVLLIVALPWLAQADQTNQDAKALLRFKASLTNSTALQNWVAGSVPCPEQGDRWVGVRCTGGVLWALRLDRLGLAGTMDVEALVGLNNLRLLNVAQNNFEGPLPRISLIGALKAVFFSSNGFSGDIPADAFSNMRSLKKVHLSHNHFTGRIPSSLGEAPRLLEAMLDDNSFTGTIPSFEQKGLRKLNFSKNKLGGPIPLSLRSWNTNVFAGNDGLCGQPLDDVCETPKKTSRNHPIFPIVLGVVIPVTVIAAVATCILHRPRKRDADHEITACKMEDSGCMDDKMEKGSLEGPGIGKKTAKEQRQDQGRLVFLAHDRERFELQDLLKASAEVLRSGSFGASYKAMLLSGPTVVVKRFRVMNGVGREDFLEHMRRLGRLKHPNLLPLVAFYYRKEEKLLVTDFIDNESLVQLLHGNRSPNRPTLNWATRLKIIKGVARGLCYLYNELPTLTLPHGHLKSSNVLLNQKMEPLLTDYGLAPVTGRESAKQLMVAYKCPEYMDDGHVTRKSDVWSLGILILEILTGRYPPNFLPQGNSGAGEDLADWVNSMPKTEWADQVFDKEMEDIYNCEDEMLELLEIGLACCERNVHDRWDLGKAAERIEELNEEISVD